LPNNKQTQNAINREKLCLNIKTKISADIRKRKKNAHADDLFPLFLFFFHARTTVLNLPFPAAEEKGVS
jgi:hypothetical protein